MIRRLGHRFAAFFRATTPDPFVLAVGLTVLVFALAAALKGKGPTEIIEAWQGDAGFFGLLKFSMQMVLILVTGHALASTRPVSWALARLAARSTSGGAAAAGVAFVAILTSLLNWGLGLIVGALLAREVGRSCHRRGVAAHYPLLAAAGYAGLMCWHGGLSGTAPLMMTEASNVERFLGPELGAAIGPIDLGGTIFGRENLIITLGLLGLVPALFFFLAPRASAQAGEGAGEGEIEGIERYPEALKEPGPAAEESEEAKTALSLPERIGRHPATMALLAIPLIYACFLWVKGHGISKLDPDALNLFFLTAGLILHGSLHRYAQAAEEAVRGSTGIILQFPLYAGIMGVMRSTGLAADFAHWLADAASARSYPFLTFLSAGAVNLFVPSGGGQWAVQGPIAMSAAHDLGIPAGRVVMAVAYGDQWTNMLQPFWALPLLAITGVKAKEIIGYTALVFLLGGLWMGACLLAFSAGIL